MLLVVVVGVCASAESTGERGVQQALSTAPFSDSVVALFADDRMNPMKKEDKKLIKAAAAGNVETVRRLIVEGADVNEGGCYGTTSLMWASKRGFDTVVTILLDSGAPVEQSKSGGWTALMFAALGGQHTIASLLLNSGAIVDTDTDGSGWGRTALQIATEFGRPDVVQVLLDHNADVNKPHWDTCTPLMNACSYGDVYVVRQLFSRDDIDTTLRDMDGKDCLDMAKTDEIKQLIINHRSSKEKQRLINIGLAFADMQLPLLLLCNIYEQTVVFDDQKLTMFHCWEILYEIKSRAL